LVQGLVALGLGLFFLIDPTGASAVLGVLAAVYLLVAGAIHTLRGLTARRENRGSLLLIRGLVGLAIGVVLVGAFLLGVVSLPTGYTILAIGLIIFGALGLFTSLFNREGKPFAWGPVIVNAALLIWGLLVIFARSSVNLPVVSGWILLIVGVAILAWTLLWRQEGTVPEEGDVP
jgi:uncharacterized membrane protein HdeD (DUF308 family)